MSILYMTGFEGGDLLMDNVTTVAGAPSYSTSVLPAASPSSRSLSLGFSQSIRIPWIDDVTGTRKEPNTSVWFHSQFRFASMQSANIVGLGRNGVELVTLSWTVGTGFITLRINGVVVSTSLTTQSINTYRRLMFHISAFTAGTINVYVDGNLSTPIITHSFVGSINKPNEFYALTAAASSPNYIDDIWALDPSDGVGVTNASDIKDSGIRGQTVNGNGPTQQWTATPAVSPYTAIDDIPPSDVDYISSTSVGQKSNFTKPNLLGSAEKIAAVKIMARVGQSDASAGTKIGMGFEVGGSNNRVDITTPGAGYISNVYNTHPTDPNWTPTNYDSTELSVVSVA